MKMSASTPYLIGIDLGTTNSSLAYLDRRTQKNKPLIFSIPQLVKPGVVEKFQMLPSFLYFPAEFEFRPELLSLPWKEGSSSQFIVGEMAKKQGQEVPLRVIHSAKSWLCHSAVDRSARILPWGSPPDVPKLSPIETSRAILEYLKEAWNSVKAKNETERLEQQEIVLTVPASFDEVARELTIVAAQKAGLKQVTLLEEPMAAFYYWIANYESNWPKKLQEKCKNSGQLALVCDVGGGTTDFSLIEIQSDQKTFQFERFAVGEHLLLGGNNMDLALAIDLEQTQAKRKMSSREMSELVALCAQAKEALFQKNEPDTTTFSVLARGSTVLASALKFELASSHLEKVILNGFFPLVPWEEEEKKSSAPGFREFGLPYASDPAITRHLRKFLKKHLPEDRIVDLVLFNGGALIPQKIRDQILQQLSLWFSGKITKNWNPVVLHNKNLHLAVAYGAAYFNWVRSGKGIRISGGTPRSYFLEVQALQKKSEARSALCLLPFGTKEGEICKIDEPLFEVITRRPVAFPLYASTLRKHDHLGDVVEIREEELTSLAPVQTVLQLGRKSKRDQIPVKLEAQMTEIGLLELWLSSTDSDHRWKLQFATTENSSMPVLDPESESEITPAKDFPKNEVQDILTKTFQNPPSQASLPESLAGTLEHLLQLSKESWDLAILRQCWDLLFEVASKRNLAPEYETRWLNLIGFCLRPGKGVLGDEQRLKKIWPLLKDKVCFERHIQSRVEWWILWRRLSSGLNENQQLELFHKMPMVKSSSASRPVSTYISAQELTEMWRTAASLEHLPPNIRTEMGETLLKKIVSHPQDTKNYEFWALGRIGARVPLYAKMNRVLPALKVQSWIEKLLLLEDSRVEKFYTLAELAKKCGDRVLDIEESVREKILKQFDAHPEISGIATLSQMLKEVVALNASLQKHYFGDSLPPGIVLVSV
ncbi:MAG: Hsp70 family protein [Planctomycetota bacterium]